MEQRLMEAALSVFQQKGVRFTMDDLSRAMGISKKTVYELVESKEALIADVIGQLHADKNTDRRGGRHHRTACARRCQSAA